MKSPISGLRAAMMIALAVSLLTLTARPCSVPVFRYGLDNWAPDDYRLTVYTDVDEGVEPSDPILARLWQAVKSGQTNLELVYVQPDVPPSAGDGLQAELRIPAFSFAEGTFWKGTLTDSVVDGMLDSPMRQTVVRRLLDGVSVVWILLESGRPDEDLQAAERLSETLIKLEAELSLPDLDLLPGEDQIPLKIVFAMERLSRDDPAERFLVDALLRVEPDLMDLDHSPMAFPVFARGRALYALVGRGINADTIRDACVFLTGPCSCEVKAMHPGLDLLISADWTAGQGPVSYSLAAAAADLESRVTGATSGVAGRLKVVMGLAGAVVALLVLNLSALFVFMRMRQRQDEK